MARKPPTDKRHVPMTSEKERTAPWMKGKRAFEDVDDRFYAAGKARPSPKVQLPKSTPKAPVPKSSRAPVAKSIPHAPMPFRFTSSYNKVHRHE